MENSSSKTNKLIIPEEIFDTELLCYLYPIRFENEEEETAARLLHRICYVSLTDIEKTENIKDVILNEEEREIVFNNNWCNSENLEVKARCNDLISRFDRDKRKRKIIASESYLKAYEKNGEIENLIRSISVRDFKAVATDKFLQDVMAVIFDKFEHPFWIHKVIDALKKSYKVEELNDLSDFIASRLNSSRENNNYREEREYINAQYSLKAITKYELNKELALSFEREADQTQNNKEENTFYPHLVDDYQNAYNAAFEIKDQEPKLHSRLKKKLLKERTNFMEMLSLGGFKYRIEIPEDFIKNVEDSISQISISNFFETISLMRSIPLVNHKEIDAYIRTSQKASIVDSFFGTSLLDENGFEVGNANPFEALRTEAHVYFRQKRLYLIQKYLYLHKWSKIKTEEDFLYYFLRDNKPEFVENDNIIFWVKGIFAGLNGDFVTASFILTPQLEHALLNIAKIEKGNITSLERKRQLSPTLSAILPRLKNIFEEEVHFELNSFLQGEIDVNFRNTLLHGLFKFFEIEKYGPYLWWLSIKLFFDYKRLMMNENKNISDIR
jgi:hypothetical protein